MTEQAGPETGQSGSAPDPSDVANPDEPPTPDQAALQREAQTFRGTHIVVAPLDRPAPPIMLTLPGTMQFPEDDAVSPEATAMQDSLRRLADANERARTASLERLEAWFPGFDFEAAAQATDDRRFTLMQIGSTLFEHLDALATVEDLLATRDLVGNRIQFSHGEIKGQEPDQVLNPAAPNLRHPQIGPLVNALDNQWTTILNGIDGTDPKVSAVVEDLERVFGCRINTNVYISWGEALGFGPHWDQHDTIIVPAAGKKVWKVFEPTTLSPLRPWVGPEVSERPVWEGTIEPGMCLVIPRGWGHEVAGSEDLAIHYTIGVNRVTAQDSIERLIAEGGLRPVLRADLAYDPSKQTHSYDVSVHDDDVLADTVAEMVSPALINRALATYRARMPLRMFPRLYDMWVAAGLKDWSGMTVRMPVPAGVHILGATPQGVAVAMNDRKCMLTHDAFAIVTELADARHHGVDALASRFERPLVETVLEEMARAGLLDVASAD